MKFDSFDRKVICLVILMSLIYVIYKLAGGAIALLSLFLIIEVLTSIFWPEMALFR